MLVLSRRENESIYLPGLDVEFKVIGIRGGRVQIGIAAPREIEITRSLEGPPQNTNKTVTDQQALTAQKSSRKSASTVVKPAEKSSRSTGRLLPRRMLACDMVAVANVCGK